MPDDALSRLRRLLRELFQLGDAELDFGIYRVMKARSREVDRFLEHELAPRVRAAFERHRDIDREALEKSLAEARLAGKTTLGLSDEQVEQSPGVMAIHQRLAMLDKVEGLEQDVFARLADFFSRYYASGDFHSRRRYRDELYAIPYQGEEVKLHWANADQYYIKTTDRLSHYAFTLPGGLRVRFDVVGGGGEDRDNSKATKGNERRFQIGDDCPIAVEGETLRVRFVYRPDPNGADQATHNALVADKISQAGSACSAWIDKLTAPYGSGNRTVLGYHLDRFTKRQTFDYFIHKDLGGFLRRELDHYLKTEVMGLDDVESHTSAARVEEYLSMLRVIRSLGRDIIAFLAQLEDFQKRLWLKKKFVHGTHWLVSLGLIPQALWPAIAANSAQREAWVRLLAIDKVVGDLERAPYEVPLSLRFLEQNPSLVVDTSLFDAEFTAQLLEALGDLDARSLGLLVHGENFQSLRLLEERFRTRVRCVYIDPPYNTGGDGFVYKDNYQRSSWLSMLNDRVRLGARLLRSDGSFWMSIDDHEFPSARWIGDAAFGPDNFVACNVWQKRYSRDNRPAVGVVHDYVLLYAADLAAFERTRNLLPLDDESRKVYRNPNNDPRGPWRPVPLTAQAGHATAAQFYEIVTPGGATHKPPEGRCWSVTRQKFEQLQSEGQIWFGTDGRAQPNLIRYLSEVPGLVPWTWWPHNEAGHTDEAVKAIYELFAVPGEFSTPKPVRLITRILNIGTHAAAQDIVLDYFGGTGTTADAVLRLNASDNGDRRFVLVEAGAHFDTILKPRVVKLMHARDWQDGAPRSRQGTLGVVQVIRLESYDDTLDNLLTPELKDRQGIMFGDSGAPTAFGMEYFLRYILEDASRGSPSLVDWRSLERPFDRRLRVTQSDGVQEVVVDIPETFHYLLGMTVRRVRWGEHARVSWGDLPDGRKACVIWRDLPGLGAEALEAWFLAEVRDHLAGVDVLFVNGDHSLERLRPTEQRWVVERSEPIFVRAMFESTDDGV